MPSVDDIRKEIVFEDILEYMEIYGVVNSEGKYLSYDELKYRLQPGDDLKTAWVATKFSRSCIMKNISIDCKNEKPFTFCVPDSLQAILHEIDMNISRGINNESSMINDDYKKYFISSLFEESISSAQLEGASTTRKVAKEMLEKERAPLNKSEKMAVNNYYLMTKVKEYSDKELSKEMILELHEIAVQGAVENEAEPGRFRDSDDIFVRDNEDNIVHNPPKHETINQYITQLCEFANNDHDGLGNINFIHPVLKAIILHFMIGYIHPFADGNGRVARALFYWFLLRKGYWIMEYVSISRLIIKAPAKYGKAYLDTENDENDMTYFLYHQADLLNRAILAFYGYVKSKKEERADFIQKIEKSGLAKTLNSRQIEILKKAFHEPGRIFIPKEIGNKYNVSLNSARTDLMKLSDLDLLIEIKGHGKSKEYIAPANLKDKL